jgi:SAM-dependent methyltransferase
MLPDDLRSRRALDVGTFDGFWAFEMERRGASVTAIDVERIDDAEWPPHKREELKRDVERHEVELGTGFRLAAEALRSQVRRVVCDVYDLERERIGGPVDLVFSGTILLHLRDPVRALERIRSVLAPGGELRLIEPFSLGLTLCSPRRPVARLSTLETPFNWWVPNLAALDAWLHTAGFVRVRRLGYVRPPARREMRQRYVGVACRPVG